MEKGEITLTLPLNYESVGWLLALVKAMPAAEARVRAAMMDAEGAAAEPTEPADTSFGGDTDPPAAPWPEADGKITQKDLRDLAIKLVDDGRSKQLKEILSHYKVKYLTAVPEASYADLKAELEKELNF